MLETEYPISGDPAATLSFPGVMAIIGSATGAAIVCFQIVRGNGIDVSLKSQELIRRNAQRHPWDRRDKAELVPSA